MHFTEAVGCIILTSLLDVTMCIAIRLHSLSAAGLHQVVPASFPQQWYFCDRVCTMFLCGIHLQNM